ncbi:ATP-binding cassette domain-containing protein [Streptomyces sp. RP5T]|uniref:phosphoketolase family protein n=1 Tax=Streptomyces sp. RP5T TaxID=2490848 RepID=UPI00289D8F97|nr:ATP-binding cassette domain-containing protein [Streptomyces sp. RP5T]
MGLRSGGRVCWRPTESRPVTRKTHGVAPHPDHPAGDEEDPMPSPPAPPCVAAKLSAHARLPGGPAGRSRRGENGSGKTHPEQDPFGSLPPRPGRSRHLGRHRHQRPGRACHLGVRRRRTQSYANWPLSARENITLGQPTEEGDDAVLAAARAAGADEVVDGLRSGLNTLLAKEWWGGQELSGGQCQRIALARAFHRPAGLLVMDEPTAALDPRAEHRIFTGLRRLAVDRTVVLVTAGDLPAAVAAEAIPLLRGNRGRRVRVVNLLDLTVLGDPMTWPRGLSDADIDHYFGRHAAVLVVTLGHPAAVWGLLAGRLRRPTEVIGWREPRGPMPQAQLTDTLGMTPAGLVRAASRLLASREAA